MLKNNNFFISEYLVLNTYYYRPRRFTLKGYKQFFFVCRDLQLSYYRGNDETDCVEKFDLRGCEVSFLFFFFLNVFCLFSSFQCFLLFFSKMFILFFQYIYFFTFVFQCFFFFTFFLQLFERLTHVGMSRYS